MTLMHAPTGGLRLLPRNAHGPARLRRLMLGLAIALAMALVGLAHASDASASYQRFCPQAQSSILVSANDRCVHGYVTNLNKVTFVLYNSQGQPSSGVDHCAVAKQTSSGGGGDVIAPGCGTSAVQSTGCVSNRAGYATGINRSDSRHYYAGEFYYNQSNLSGCVS